MILLPTLAFVLMACGGAAADDPTGSASPSDTTTAESTDESSHRDEPDGAHDEIAFDEESTHGHPGDGVAGGHQVDRRIEVTATDFAFDPASIEVVAGETVEFVVANGGTIEHEFRMTTHHAIQEHLEAGHSDHGDDDGHDMMVVVPPGATDTLVVTFAEGGEVELFACLLPGHYEAGMEGELRIES